VIRGVLIRTACFISQGLEGVSVAGSAISQAKSGASDGRRDALRGSMLGGARPQIRHASSARLPEEKPDKITFPTRITPELRNFRESARFSLVECVIGSRLP